MEIKKDEIQLHFIVGMSRSGTTWLGTCLGLHPEAAVFGETNFWGRHYVEPKNGRSYRTKSEIEKIFNILSDRTWAATTGDTSGYLKYLDKYTYKKILTSVSKDICLPVKPGILFKQIGVAIADFEHAKIVFEKTPHHLNWIERINRELPQSKFIVLIRDPYGFVLSMKYMKPYSLWDHYLIRHPFILSLLWRKYITSYETMKLHYHNRIISFRLDEIKNNSKNILSKIYAFFNISQTGVPSADIKRNSSFENSYRAKLKSSDIFWINIILNKHIKKHNFDKRNIPLNVFEIFLSFLILPLSFLTVAIKVVNYIPGFGGRYLREWFS